MATGAHDGGGQGIGRARQKPRRPTVGSTTHLGNATTRTEPRPEPKLDRLAAAAYTPRVVERGFRPQTTPCSLCAGEDLTFLYKQKDRNGHLIRLTVCNRCGLTQLNPRREDDAEVDFYASDYNEIFQQHARSLNPSKVARRTEIAVGLLDAVAELLPLGGARVVDIGCGYGHLLGEARARGASVAGVEPDRRAAASARNAGFDVFAGNLQEFARQASRPFDVVTISHVVEHIGNPIPFLETAGGLLRPSGVVAVQVPNLEHYLAVGKHPDKAHSAHVAYHTEATLRGLFAVSGLSVASSGSAQGGRHVYAVGSPAAGSVPVTLPFEDPDRIRAAHVAAIRRLPFRRVRRRWTHTQKALRKTLKRANSAFKKSAVVMVGALRGRRNP